MPRQTMLTFNMDLGRCMSIIPTVDGIDLDLASAYRMRSFAGIRFPASPAFTGDEVADMRRVQLQQFNEELQSVYTYVTSVSFIGVSAADTALALRARIDERVQVASSVTEIRDAVRGDVTQSLELIGDGVKLYRAAMFRQLRAGCRDAAEGAWMQLADDNARQKKGVAAALMFDHQVASARRYQLGVDLFHELNLADAYSEVMAEDIGIVRERLDHISSVFGLRWSRATPAKNIASILMAPNGAKRFGRYSKDVAFEWFARVSEEEVAGANAESRALLLSMGVNRVPLAADRRPSRAHREEAGEEALRQRDQYRRAFINALRDFKHWRKEQDDCIAAGGEISDSKRVIGLRFARKFLLIASMVQQVCKQQGMYIPLAWRDGTNITQLLRDADDMVERSAGLVLLEEEKHALQADYERLCKEAMTDVEKERAIEAHLQRLQKQYREAKATTGRSANSAMRKLNLAKQRRAGLMVMEFVGIANAPHEEAAKSYAAKAVAVVDDEKRAACAEAIQARLNAREANPYQRAEIKLMIMLYEQQFKVRFQAASRLSRKRQQSLARLPWPVPNCALTAVREWWVKTAAGVELPPVVAAQCEFWDGKQADRWQWAEENFLRKYYEVALNALEATADQLQRAAPFWEYFTFDHTTKKPYQVACLRLLLRMEYIEERLMDRAAAAEFLYRVLAFKEVFLKKHAWLRRALQGKATIQVFEEMDPAASEQEVATLGDLEHALGMVEQTRTDFFELEGGEFNLYPGQSLAVLASASNRLSYATNKTVENLRVAGATDALQREVAARGGLLNSDRLVSAMLGAIERQLYRGFSASYLTCIGNIEKALAAGDWSNHPAWLRLSQISQVGRSVPTAAAMEALKAAVAAQVDQELTCADRVSAEGVLEFDDAAVRTRFGKRLAKWFTLCPPEPRLRARQFGSKFFNEQVYREAYIARLKTYLAGQLDEMGRLRAASDHQASMQIRHIDVISIINERLKRARFVDHLAGAEAVTGATAFDSEHHASEAGEQGSVSLFAEFQGHVLGGELQQAADFQPVNTMESLVYYCLNRGNADQVLRLASAMDVVVIAADGEAPATRPGEFIQLCFHAEGRFFYPAGTVLPADLTEESLFAVSMRKIGTKLLSLSLACQQVHAFAEAIDGIDEFALLGDERIAACFAGPASLAAARAGVDALIDEERRAGSWFAREYRGMLGRISNALPDAEQMKRDQFGPVADKLVTKLFGGTRKFYERDARGQFKLRITAERYQALKAFVEAGASDATKELFRLNSPVRFFVVQLNDTAGYQNGGYVDDGKLATLANFCEVGTTEAQASAMRYVCKVLIRDEEWSELLSASPITPADAAEAFASWCTGAMTLEALQASAVKDSAFAKLAVAATALCGADGDPLPQTWLRNLASRYLKGQEYNRNASSCAFLRTLLPADEVEALEQRDQELLTGAANLVNAALITSDFDMTVSGVGLNIIHVGVATEFTRSDVITRVNWLVNYRSAHSRHLLTTVVGPAVLARLTALEADDFSRGCEPTDVCIDVLKLVCEQPPLSEVVPNPVARMAVARARHLICTAQGFRPLGRPGLVAGCTAYTAIADEGQRSRVMRQDAALFEAAKQDAHFVKAMQDEVATLLATKADMSAWLDALAESCLAVKAARAAAEEAGEAVDEEALAPHYKEIDQAYLLVHLTRQFGTRAQRLALALDYLKRKVARALTLVSAETIAQDLQEIFATAPDEDKAWCVAELCKQVAANVGRDFENADELVQNNYFLLLKLPASEAQHQAALIALLERVWDESDYDDLYDYASDFFDAVTIEKDFLVTWLQPKIASLTEGELDLDEYAKVFELVDYCEADKKVSECAAVFYQHCEAKLAAGVHLGPDYWRKVEPRPVGVTSAMLAEPHQTWLKQRFDRMVTEHAPVCMHVAFDFYYPVILKYGSDELRIQAYLARFTLFTNADVNIIESEDKLLLLFSQLLARVGDTRAAYDQVIDLINEDVLGKVAPSRVALWDAFIKKASYEQVSRNAGLLQRVEEMNWEVVELVDEGGDVDNYQSLRQQLVCGELDAAVERGDREEVNAKLDQLSGTTRTHATMARLGNMMMRPPACFARPYYPTVKPTWAASVTIRIVPLCLEPRVAEATLPMIESRERAHFLYDVLRSPELLAQYKAQDPEQYGKVLGELREFLANNEASVSDLLALLGGDYEAFGDLVSAAKSFVSTYHRHTPSEDARLLYQLVRRLSDRNFYSSSASREVEDLATRRRMCEGRISELEGTTNYWWGWLWETSDRKAAAAKRRELDTLTQQWERACQELEEAFEVKSGLGNLRELAQHTGFVTFAPLFDSLDQLALGDASVIARLASDMQTIVTAWDVSVRSGAAYSASRGVMPASEEKVADKGFFTLLEQRFFSVIRTLMANGRVDVRALKPLVKTLPDQVLASPRKIEPTCKKDLLACCEAGLDANAFGRSIALVNGAFANASAFLTAVGSAFPDNFEAVLAKCCHSAPVANPHAPSFEEMESMLLWLDEARLAKLQSGVEAIVAKMTKEQRVSQFGQGFHRLLANLLHPAIDRMMRGDIKQNRREWSEAVVIHGDFLHRVNLILVGDQANPVAVLTAGGFDLAAVMKVIKKLSHEEQAAWEDRVGDLIDENQYDVVVELAEVDPTVVSRDQALYAQTKQVEAALVALQAEVARGASPVAAITHATQCLERLVISWNLGLVLPDGQKGVGLEEFKSIEASLLRIITAALPDVGFAEFEALIRVLPEQVVVALAPIKTVPSIRQPLMRCVDHPGLAEHLPDKFSRAAEFAQRVRDFIAAVEADPLKAMRALCYSLPERGAFSARELMNLQTWLDLPSLAALHSGLGDAIAHLPAEPLSLQKGVAALMAVINPEVGRSQTAELEAHYAAWGDVQIVYDLSRRVEKFFEDVRKPLGMRRAIFYRQKGVDEAYVLADAMPALSRLSDAEKAGWNTQVDNLLKAGAFAEVEVFVVAEPCILTAELVEKYQQSMLAKKVLAVLTEVLQEADLWLAAADPNALAEMQRRAAEVDGVEGWEQALELVAKAGLVTRPESKMFAEACNGRMGALAANYQEQLVVAGNLNTLALDGDGSVVDHRDGYHCVRCAPHIWSAAGVLMPVYKAHVEPDVFARLQKQQVEMVDNTLAALRKRLATTASKGFLITTGAVYHSAGGVRHQFDLDFFESAYTLIMTYGSASQQRELEARFDMAFQCYVEQVASKYKSGEGVNLRNNIYCERVEKLLALNPRYKQLIQHLTDPEKPGNRVAITSEGHARVFKRFCEARLALLDIESELLADYWQLRDRCAQRITEVAQPKERVQFYIGLRDYMVRKGVAKIAELTGGEADLSDMPADVASHFPAWLDVGASALPPAGLVESSVLLIYIGQRPVGSLAVGLRELYDNFSGTPAFADLLAPIEGLTDKVEVCCPALDARRSAGVSGVQLALQVRLDYAWKQVATHPVAALHKMANVAVWSRQREVGGLEGVPPNIEVLSREVAASVVFYDKTLRPILLALVSGRFFTMSPSSLRFPAMLDEKKFILPAKQYDEFSRLMEEAVDKLSTDLGKTGLSYFTGAANLDKVLAGEPIQMIVSKAAREEASRRIIAEMTSMRALTAFREIHDDPANARLEGLSAEVVTLIGSEEGLVRNASQYFNRAIRAIARSKAPIPQEGLDRFLHAVKTLPLGRGMNALLAREFRGCADRYVDVVVKQCRDLCAIPLTRLFDYVNQLVAYQAPCRSMLTMISGFSSDAKRAELLAAVNEQLNVWVRVITRVLRGGYKVSDTFSELLADVVGIDEARRILGAMPDGSGDRTLGKVGLMPVSSSMRAFISSQNALPRILRVVDRGAERDVDLMKQLIEANDCFATSRNDISKREDLEELSERLSRAAVAVVEGGDSFHRLELARSFIMHHRSDALVVRLINNDDPEKGALGLLPFLSREMGVELSKRDEARLFRCITTPGANALADFDRAMAPVYRGMKRFEAAVPSEENVTDKGMGSLNARILVLRNFVIDNYLAGKAAVSCGLVMPYGWHQLFMMSTLQPNRVSRTEAEALRYEAYAEQKEMASLEKGLASAAASHEAKVKALRTSFEERVVKLRQELHAELVKERTRYERKRYSAMGKLSELVTQCNESLALRVSQWEQVLELKGLAPADFEQVEQEKKAAHERVEQLRAEFKPRLVALEKILADEQSKLHGGSLLSRELAPDRIRNAQAALDQVKAEEDATIAEVNREVERAERRLEAMRAELGVLRDGLDAVDGQSAKLPHRIMREIKQLKINRAGYVREREEAEARLNAEAKPAHEAAVAELERNCEALIQREKAELESQLAAQLREYEAAVAGAHERNQRDRASFATKRSKEHFEMFRDVVLELEERAGTVVGEAAEEVYVKWERVKDAAFHWQQVVAEHLKVQVEKVKVDVAHEAKVREVTARVAGDLNRQITDCEGRGDNEGASRLTKERDAKVNKALVKEFGLMDGYGCMILNTASKALALAEERAQERTLSRTVSEAITMSPSARARLVADLRAEADGAAYEAVLDCGSYLDREQDQMLHQWFAERAAASVHVGGGFSRARAATTGGPSAAMRLVMSRMAVACRQSLMDSEKVYAGVGVNPGSGSQPPARGVQVR